MDRGPSTGTNSIFVFIFGFICGILASSFVFISPLVSIFIIFIGFAIIVAERIWNKKLSQEVLFVSLALLSFGCGAARYSVKDFHEPLIPASEGVIVSEPEQRENTTRFVLRSDNREKVLVSTDLYRPVQYGDRVKVDGKLTKPGVIESENGGQPFDYAQYLSKDDIYFTVSFAKVEVLSHGHGNPLKRALLRVKHNLVAKMKKILAEPESSLLAGLIVAGKGALPRGVLEEFRRAGVIHVVVLSGYNITIIAEFLRKIFESFFSVVRIQATPRLAASASMIGILLFVLMTGGEATIVRAALMVLLVIMAKMFGRHYSASRALLAAGFLMLLVNPKILVFDPSFQLSFLAMLALIYIVPIVERYLKRAPFIPRGLSEAGEKWGVQTVIATTIATQITVLPLLIYSMGNFSLVALPANILILFFIPGTMFIGFIAALSAYASLILALPFAYIAHLLLAWILGVSSYLGNLSFASIAIAPFPFWAVMLMYLGLFILVYRAQSSLRKSAS